MRPRRNRPLFIIDIAMPRDVEAAAGEIEQVFLYNIDDLQATVRENLARRASEVAHAEAIVGEEVEKFGAWLRSRGAIPTVVALRQRFEAIRRAELERLDFKLSALPPDARARVDEITRLIVEKLLLTPTEQLKSLGDAETVGAYSEALTRLFGLGRSLARRGQPMPEPHRVRAIVRASSRFDRIEASSPLKQPRADDLTPCELRLGTRGSQLALWQANTVAARIAEAGGPPLPASSSSRRRATGCRTRRFRRSAASGCSSRRSRTRCSGDEIDLAVHSSKDMPAVLPDGLAIAAVLPREDPHDAVVLPDVASRITASPSDRIPRRDSCVDDRRCLGQSPSIGTSSVRRIAQLTRLFPGARFAPIRGNLDTRLRKLDAGEHDALVLAAAGLRRLGLRVADLVRAAGSRLRAGAGTGHRRDRDPRATTTRVRRAVAPIDDRGGGRGADGRARAGRQRSAAAARRRSARWRRRSTTRRSSSWRRSSPLDGSRAVRSDGARPRRPTLAATRRAASRAAAASREGADDILAEARRRTTPSMRRQP